MQQAGADASPAARGAWPKYAALSAAALLAGTALVVASSVAAGPGLRNPPLALDADARRLQASPASRAWKLRSAKTGCSNWPIAQHGEVTYEDTPDDCGRRCAADPKCLGFGYQRLAASDWRWGQPKPGTCSMWWTACADMKNPYWDDYAMTDHAALATKAVYEKTLLTVPDASGAFAPGVHDKKWTATKKSVDVADFTLENIDLGKLKDHPDLYDDIVSKLKRDLSDKLGVKPEDVKLDLSKA